MCRYVQCAPIVMAKYDILSGVEVRYTTAIEEVIWPNVESPSCDIPGIVAQVQAVIVAKVLSGEVETCSDVAIGIAVMISTVILPKLQVVTR